MSIDGKSDVSPVTPKREAVIAKIRALMAKTVENGATEAEAKAASAKIHKLMSAYAIEVTDTAIEVTYTGDGDVERPRRRRAAGNPWSPDDRILLEEERRQLTGYSRGWWFQLERQPSEILRHLRAGGFSLSEGVYPPSISSVSSLRGVSVGAVIARTAANVLLEMAIDRSTRAILAALV